MHPGSDLATILVVESDMALGKVMSRVLARQGLDVVRASNADQALELAEQHKPRLALVDCGSRESEGPKLVEELQSRHAGLPFIVLTDYPWGPGEISPGTDHFIQFLTKPINLPDLRQAVETALASVGSAECGMRSPLGRRAPQMKGGRRNGLQASFRLGTPYFAFLHSAFLIPHSTFLGWLLQRSESCLLSASGYIRQPV